ncbi:hypothetical protein GGX14DRAFT_651116 [Mycena pura]|uniref:Uncharacterized protein n=1 Tax=Mycena pura TaxID=153505 RepID=A0AAD6YNR8_9AGAR|nr:hypothetical protein GGX14DRAFT_651116 [Mycena pura]
MVYANFFNDTITLRVALQMDATPILKKFDDFVDRMDYYQVHKEARDSLGPAVKAIKDIYERTNPRKAGQDPGYYTVNSKLSSLPVRYQSNTFELRTLYDIVGWILSVVGPVPSIAKRDNYYYPLMMIGYVFCAKLIPTQAVEKNGKKQKPSAGPPEVWSVMWFKDEQQVARVVVGANLDQPGKIPKNNAKDFRKSLLDTSHILGWDTKQPSIMQQLSARGTGQDFGHCAETYPLLFICSLSHAQNIAGLAKVKKPPLFKRVSKDWLLKPHFYMIKSTPEYCSTRRPRDDEVYYEEAEDDEVYLS